MPEGQRGFLLGRLLDVEIPPVWIQFHVSLDSCKPRLDLGSIYSTLREISAFLMAVFAQMLKLPSNKHVYISQAATISGSMWLQATGSMVPCASICLDFVHMKLLQ